MAVIFGSLLLPVTLVMTLFILAAGRLILRWAQDRGWIHQPRSRRHAPPRRGLGATATEELHALIYGGKRAQLEQRRIELVLRDDEDSGAPPNCGIDLDAGTATIRLPRQPSAQA